MKAREIRGLSFCPRPALREPSWLFPDARLYWRKRQEEVGEGLMSDELKQAALDYHQFPRPGKLEIQATKSLANQRDLALAYSPGVAEACMAIVDDAANAYRYTVRGNMVGVITNGTAVLGLGEIGALASKPVMEGKAVLFKKFAGVDVFDIEVNETDPDKLIEIVAALEPTFGAINLEDIKSPECFVIEEKLKARMSIPVFHDDQHGTAICVNAAVYNGLRVVGKNAEDCKVVCSGAGAAALAVLGLLIELGIRPRAWTPTRSASPATPKSARSTKPSRAPTSSSASRRPAC
jgi:malate dehydrogenase (oxaloacetate-decarboxylating)(NADP+)